MAKMDTLELRLAANMTPQPREPEWMEIARSLLGKKEIPGTLTAPFIGIMLHSMGAWWNDDETPWCATFASWCLAEAALQPPKAFFRAKAFLTWGRPLVSTCRHYATGCPIPYGTIMVRDRIGGGHVHFFVGMHADGLRYYALGGNQGNAVTVGLFTLAEATPRWPEHVPCRCYKPSPALLANLFAGSPRTAETLA